MGDGCIECRKKREEMIYWSNFQTIQFCQILTGSFERQLAIPKKFVKNARGKLTGKIMLRGPSKSIWEVELMTNGDTLFLKHGWKAFVEDHFLEENDILIFKYIGDSRFDVVMFDKRSLCEKEASYFVRKCAHMENGSGTRRRSSIVEGCEDTDDSSDDTEEYYQVKKPRTAAERTPKSRRQPSRATAKRRGGLCERETLCFVKKCARTENGSGSSQRKSMLENFDDPDVSSDDVAEHRVKSPRNDAAKTPTSRRQPSQATTKSRRGTKKYKRGSSRSYTLILKSHRREVTAEEIETTRHMAVAAATALEDSFMVVMRATHVYKRFYLSIPSHWTRLHVGGKNQEVELRYKEKAWKAKYYYPDRGNCYTRVLTGGWKEFAIDNALEEYDTCVFNSLGGTLGTLILDVKIFRVVEDVIPPSRMI